MHWANLFTYDSTRPLIFTSETFLTLFAGFYFWYVLLLKTERDPTLRIGFTVLFSLFFYYKSGGVYLVLLLLSALLNYSVSLLIHRSQNSLHRKLFLTAGLAGSLGVLLYYKYTAFFITTLTGLFGGNMGTINIFLPVGISFYTFQILSYTLDVYQDRLDPRVGLLDFLFYVSFFPQLVAGPIVRATDLLPQLRQPVSLSRQELGQALHLIALGLIKKGIISDYISVHYVDRIFDNPDLHTGFENLMGIYGYALQIYCDFSGYSDLAIGLALLMGFRLLPNFNLPYKAKSLRDFWRRWHISLSTWLRDYLYIPLGGNRKGWFRHYLNILITMTLGGLWHGASWTFVLWGLLHGLGLVVERMFTFPMGRFRIGFVNDVWAIGKRLVLFHFIAFAWILFRATSLEKAGIMLDQVNFRFGWERIPELLAVHRYALGFIVLRYIMHFFPDRPGLIVKNTFIAAPDWVKVLCLSGILLLIHLLRSVEFQPFIYFQF